MISSFLSWFFLPRNYLLMWNSFYTTWVNRQRGQMLHYLGFGLIRRSFLNPLCPKRSRRASCSKDVVKLGEDELYCLVLVNHIYRHVAIVPLRAHQGRPKHDADVLGGHSVDFWTLQHSIERQERVAENNINKNNKSGSGKKGLWIDAVLGFNFHTSRMVLRTDLSGGPPLWPGLKYLRSCLMKCHENVYRHFSSLDDVSCWLLWSCDISLSITKSLTFVVSQLLELLPLNFFVL